MTDPKPSVGWIGLGNIGAPMARRVLAAGLPLRVWARRPESTRDLALAGAIVADTPEALARDCDVVATIVGGPDDVRELHRRMMPASHEGSVFVDLTTASPENAKESGALAARFRVHAIDAPVTGGVAGATRGTLTCFVGGQDDALACARPMLATFCQRIVHCGKPGAGYRMKLVNQTIVAGTLLGLAEGAALARSWGMAAPLVTQALGAGTASGFLFDAYVPRMIEPGGAVTFTLGMLRKDLGLARAEARAQRGSSRFLDDTLAAVEAACARHGDEAGVQFLAAPDPG